jgi:predicted nucleic acid-binding protein
MTSKPFSAALQAALPCHLLVSSPICWLSQIGRLSLKGRLMPLRTWKCSHATSIFHDAARHGRAVGTAQNRTQRGRHLLHRSLCAQTGNKGVDNLIAATALCHNLTVVTRNVKDFEPTGVRVLNPFG